MIEQTHLGALPLEERRELLKNLLNLQSGGATGQFALSHGQTSLWFLNQLAPASPAYNFLYAARILSPLDRGLFGRACRILLERHPLLRARFALHDNKPIHVVDQSPSFDIPEVDASSWDE